MRCICAVTDIAVGQPTKPTADVSNARASNKHCEQIGRTDWANRLGEPIGRDQMKRAIPIAFALACGLQVALSCSAAAKRRENAYVPPAWTEVAFSVNYPVGSIVVVNRERALYFVSEDGKARKYPVAIGTADEQWTGKEVVSDMRENPRWFQIVDGVDDTPEPIPGGHPKNPLGVRALYLGKTLWRIHGTIAPNSIGKAVSNGCIRMHNAHVVDLFERVAIGAEVFVIQSLVDRRPMRRGRKLES